MAQFQDPLVKARFVELAGKPYRLHFTARAMATAELDLGFSVLPMGRTPFWESLGSVLYTMRLLYAGTRENAASLTYEKLTLLVEESDFGEIALAVDQAFTDFFQKLLPKAQREIWEEHRRLALALMEEAAASNPGSSSTTTPDTPSDSASESSGEALSGKSAA